ncbi:hypothetical protein HT031_002835 [Scenedesmus sp. PABB004]|nr:hypothetical protein HT031_002835 [Scenedesmus sp. PABB004]
MPNALDFIQGVALLPWELNNLGAVFGARRDKAQCVASRARVVLRRGGGDDGAAAAPPDGGGPAYGNVMEALGDVGFNLRSGEAAFHVGASNLSLRAGADAPLRATSAVGGTLASLKLAYAQEVAEDRFVGLSYDFGQRKPELSLAWAGDALTEQASLALTLDPVDRAARLRAGVTFPGPEWRRDAWDLASRSLQLVPVERGSRHTVWVQHEARRGDLLASTQLGARLDVGRLANLAGGFVDRQIEPRVPLLLWRLPFAQRLYRLAVPAEDADQLRYRIKGWAAELSHDFDRAGPTVGLSKQLGAGDTRLAASYDTASATAGVELRGRWLAAAARLTRQEDGGWRSPSVQLLVQPLGFL